MEEFIDLINSTNEALDVDLSSLVPLNNQISRDGEKASQAIAQLSKNASGHYENRLNNQLRLYLQKSSQPIARDCLNEDEGEEGNKTYLIERKKLK